LTDFRPIGGGQNSLWTDIKSGIIFINGLMISGM
jgi:hypothetical protein